MQKRLTLPFNNIVHRSRQCAQIKPTTRLAAARTPRYLSERRARTWPADVSPGRNITEVSYRPVPAFSRAPEYDALSARFAARKNY